MELNRFCDCVMKLMKSLLLIQSLSPIALLMLLKIVPFSEIWDKPKTFWAYLSNNLCFSVLFVLFVVWLLLSVFGWVYIRSFNKIEFEKKDVSISKLEEDKESGLNFFMTFLLPLVIDDVAAINGFLVFICLFVGVIVLLAKTTLFYKNPVLILLGYRMFNFKIDGVDKIGICTKVKEIGIIKYSTISDGVVFFKMV